MLIGSPCYSFWLFLLIVLMLLKINKILTVLNVANLDNYPSHICHPFFRGFISGLVCIGKKLRVNYLVHNFYHTVFLH